MAILTPAQLQASNASTYTTNGANLITGANAKNFNIDFISSSITVSQTGSMNVLSASFAGTASVLLGSVVSASYAVTSSNALTASFFSGSISNAISSSYAGTASVLLGSIVSASYSLSGSYAQTASFVTTAQTASFVTTAQTASYVLNAVSSSIAVTSSFAISSSFAQTASYAEIATYTSEWILGANANSDYTFTGPGFTASANDPTIYLVRGQQYKFTNTMGAHPFRIQITVNGSTGTQYNNGVTNNDVSNGTLLFNVPMDVPEVLYYQCTSHAAMGGPIYLLDQNPATASFAISASLAQTASFALNAGTSIDTGSFATTGSNTFIGNQIITGSLLVSGSAATDITVVGRMVISGQSTGASTPTLTITGSDRAFTLIGRNLNNINTTLVNSVSNASGQIYANTGSVAGQYIGVYDDPGFNTDVEVAILVDQNGSSFNDFDNATAFDYVPFMTLTPNLGNNPTPQMKRGLGITGSLDVSGNFKLGGGMSNLNVTNIAISGSIFSPSISCSLDISNLNAYQFAFNQNYLGDSLTGAQFTAETNKDSSYSELKFNARYSASNDANITVRNVPSGSDSIATINTVKTSILGSLNVAGNLLLASGSNKTTGIVTLNGGSPGAVTVSNTLVASTSMIFLTKQTNATTGSVAISAKSGGSFTITSTSNGDADQVAYMIVNPG